MTATDTTLPWEVPDAPATTFVQAKEVLAASIAKRQKDQGITRSEAIAQSVEFAHRLQSRIVLPAHQQAFAIHITQLMADERVRAAINRASSLNSAAALECVYVAIRDNRARGTMEERECVSQGIGWGRANVAPRIADLEQLHDFLVALTEMELQHCPISRNGLDRCLGKLCRLQKEFDELGARDPRVDRMALMIACEGTRLRLHKERLRSLGQLDERLEEGFAATV